VKAKTKNYITLVPGDETGKEFLKAILQALALNLPKEQREKVEKVSIELVREFVPYTRGQLVKN
jgi:ribosomal protein L18E